MKKLTLVIPLIGCFAFSDCGIKGHNGDDEDSDSSGTSDDSQGIEGDSASAMIQAEVTGTVTVQLYRDGEDGERELVAWEDSTCGGTYSFGKIFVTAYREDASPDGKRYLAEDVVDSPTTGANSYDLNLSMAAEGPVYVYAVVDYWGDRVIGTNDPIGVYPMPVEILDGTVNGDIDITVLVPECYTGGGSCGTTSVSGDVLITTAYAGGEAAAMLIDTSGYGPYHATWTTPSASGGGAEGPYALGTCVDYGNMQLIGCWDSNGNTLADPLDKWGKYISAPDEDGNPVNIGSSAITGADIQIPLGDESGISLVPWVNISGAVSVANGAFDDLNSGTTVYVVALKYRPNGDVDVSSLTAEAYDTQEIPWSQLAGESSVDWSLTVPANTIAYLWAYADEDSDGVVNESGEHVGSGGQNGVGRFPTGTTSTSGQNLELGTPDSE